MKATIQVESRREAADIDAGLKEPTMRAFVRIMGILRALPTDRDRRRALRFVSEEMGPPMDEVRPAERAE